MRSNTTGEKAQIVYFSHGGGPLPILGDESHKAMIEFLQQLPSHLERPDSILVISAHWEEDVATLLGARRPPLFYDYYGFPDEAYAIAYPCLETLIWQAGLSGCCRTAKSTPGLTPSGVLTTDYSSR